ncbi:solute carrier family 35 member B1-like [Dysidea avara]|uniref:solute carrier family 35 member B1-like n=1 Tax=Dysidea avara TaxID=196820 RepID=UPI0033336479
MAEPHSGVAVNIKEFDDAVPSSPREMSSKASSPEPPKNPPGFGLWAVCAGGIFVCYFFYGLLQEKITKRDYDGEHFHYFGYLVFIQCIINALFAYAACAKYGVPAELDPMGLMSVCSFTYVGAMLTSNSSLAYVSYPAQVLAKSCKPIPVLVFSLLLGGKSYGLSKFFTVGLIVSGVTVFMYKEHHPTSGDSAESVLGFGQILLLASLLMDGVTAAMQERLRTNNLVTSPYRMMFAVNLFSALYLCFFLLVTGEGWEGTQFVRRHPSVIVHILFFSVASALGQNFIFMTIMAFGPLTLSLVTTTRKFFTILASVLLFSNSLLWRQWIGVLLVFSGLAFDIVFSKKGKKVQKK